jgi:hypothetical protein
LRSYLDLQAMLQGMRHLARSKDHSFVFMKLRYQWFTNGVVFATDLECGCILDFGITSVCNPANVPCK